MCVNYTTLVHVVGFAIGIRLMPDAKMWVRNTLTVFNVCETVIIQKF